MSAADRSARQRAADHVGREARVQAVTRDLLADVEFYRPTSEAEEET